MRALKPKASQTQKACQRDVRGGSVNKQLHPRNTSSKGMLYKYFPRVSLHKFSSLLHPNWAQLEAAACKGAHTSKNVAHSDQLFATRAETACVVVCNVHVLRVRRLVWQLTVGMLRVWRVRRVCVCAACLALDSQPQRKRGGVVLFKFPVSAQLLFRQQHSRRLPIAPYPLVYRQLEKGCIPCILPLIFEI